MTCGLASIRRRGSLLPLRSMRNGPDARRRLTKYGRCDDLHTARRRRLTRTFAANETNGMTDETTPASVYVDANPFIYFIDGEEAVASRLRPFFELLKGKPGLAMTSELTLAEVLAKARPDARRNYFNLIVWSNLFKLQPVTRDILIDTADYRRVSQTPRPDGTKATVKLPDAIH